jgi:hypothetical protein
VRFFFEKIVCHLKNFIKTRPLQGFTLKEPGMKEVFEFNHEMLGGLSMRDPQGSPTMCLRVVGLGLAHELELGEI